MSVQLTTLPQVEAALSFGFYNLTIVNKNFQEELL
jgi:hypothetical protein